MTKDTSSQSDSSVKDFIASLNDEQAIKDCHILIEMMQRISGHEPKMWNVGTIGFDTYHYKYDSGREGDGQIIGFYARKGKITVYLMDGTVRYSELLAQLGKHTTSRVCLYFKRLSDIQLPILEQIVQQSYNSPYAVARDLSRVFGRHKCRATRKPRNISYKYVKSQDGHMHRAIE